MMIAKVMRRMMEIGAAVADWVPAISAGFAGLGLLFTGWQVRESRLESQDVRRLGIDAVGVSWEPIEAPDHPESDGSAQWLYEVRANNPGRFPVDNVVVRMHFSMPVVRLRYSGRRGEPTSVLTLRHPVLLGGAERQWKRRIEFDFALRGDLRDTFAEITFRDPKTRTHTNRWPRV
jgi:hypothetical protein